MPSALTTFGPRLIVASTLLILFLLLNVAFRDRSTRALYRDTQAVTATYEVIGALDGVLLAALDAEAAERGFLITGQEPYLDPYDDATRRAEAQLARLASLVESDPLQRTAAAELRVRVQTLLDLFAETIAIYRSGGPSAAAGLVLTGRTRAALDAVRGQVRAMQAREQDRLRERVSRSEAQYRIATVTGVLTGLLGVLMTVALVWTARARSLQQAAAAASLHRERELLRVTLASIGDGVIATDTASTVTWLNSVAESLTGWRQAEAEGRALPDVFRIVNEDTRAPVENPVTRALRDGAVVGLANHTVLIAKDGAERPIADSAAPIRGASGEVLGAVLVFRDVTEERRAEQALSLSLRRERSWAERLRQVAAASLTINAASTQESIAGVIDAEARRILGAGSCQVVFDEAGCAEAEGELLVPLQTRSGRAMGYIRCRDKASGAFDDDDRATLTQIAQMASIALENSRLYNEIRTSDLRKDEFLATLAHELRNPLAPITHSLELLRQAGEGPHASGSRAVIERQVGQLVHLVDDLLDLSRVSRGKLELRRKRVRLSDVLEAAVETSRPAVEAQRHGLEVRQPAEEVWLDADLTRLAQVFANLLNNSAKYMEPGGRIVLEAEALPGDEVVVRVRDTGIGIAPEMLPHVFDMFVQADRSLERAQGGLGIGLTLVKRLVELHGGSVTASSAGPGTGSEFVVRLPRVQPPETQPPAAEASAPPAALPSRRVLVVDDNKDAVDSLSLLLTIAGQTVASAADGIEALRQVEAFRPDVVILDIGLPGLNGYEVARRIRATPGFERLVLVALTGWGQDDDRRRTEEAGFDHHLVKPIDFDALEALLAGL